MNWDSLDILKREKIEAVRLLGIYVERKRARWRPKIIAGYNRKWCKVGECK